METFFKKLLGIRQYGKWIDINRKKHLKPTRPFFSAQYHGQISLLQQTYRYIAQKTIWHLTDWTGTYTNIQIQTKYKNEKKLKDHSNPHRTQIKADTYIHLLIQIQNTKFSRDWKITNTHMSILIAVRYMQIQICNINIQIRNTQMCRDWKIKAIAVRYMQNTNIEMRYNYKILKFIFWNANTNKEYANS